MFIIASRTISFIIIILSGGWGGLSLLLLLYCCTLTPFRQRPSLLISCPYFWPLIALSYILIVMRRKVFPIPSSNLTTLDGHVDKMTAMAMETRSRKMRPRAADQEENLKNFCPRLGWFFARALYPIDLPFCLCHPWVNISSISVSFPGYLLCLFIGATFPPLSAPGLL